MKFGIGQPVRRKEDVRFVTGRGRYMDDIRFDNEAHAYFVRSTHAHAVIKNIDVSAARAAPGVLAVMTDKEISAMGAGFMPKGRFPVTNRDGSDVKPPPKTLLAGDRVRFVGEAVVMIVAETSAQAKDAVELVNIDYDPLPVVTLKSPTTGEQIWNTNPQNICADFEVGNREATDAAFAQAATVVSLDIRQNRVVANPMETRAAIGLYDAEKDNFILYASSQGPGHLRNRISEMLQMPIEKVRVITPDVGGAFGMKGASYPEQGLVMLASKAIGRPVKWTPERSEAFLTDAAGRDTQAFAELALDKDAIILGVRMHSDGNVGGHLSQHGAFVQTAGTARVLGGVYRIANGYANMRAFYTNTGPTDAYRGAGRPEAAYMIDRLLDTAAKKLGMDPLEIRRRNLITKEEIPYKTWIGATIDSGDFVGSLQMAAERSHFIDYAKRKKETEAKDKIRGRGVSYYVESSGASGTEPALIRFMKDGTVVVHAGTQSNGQGHETAFPQLVADQLGVPYEKIVLKEGDTNDIVGGGTGGSRSTTMAGNAIVATCHEVIKKGKMAAGHVLQAGGSDVEFTVEDGVGSFKVANTTRRITVTELATTMQTETIPGLEAGLDSDGTFTGKSSTYPNGCHICEIEIDPETGHVEVVRYHVVDDFGRVINPLLLEGQVHGGIAQGLGQVLLEDCVYDEESGQLLTASFMDYAMPRAENMPPLDLVYNEILCKTNPLGTKGAGEAGNVGALPAIMNAVVDALGGTIIDMPATPEKVWRALQAAH